MTATDPAAPIPAPPVTVLCMKWGAKYGPDYVNRLYAMVARNLRSIEAGGPGSMLCITADHGNADEMFQRDKKGKIVRDAAGQPTAKTSHTLSPVPFLIHDPMRGDRYEIAEMFRMRPLGDYTFIYWVMIFCNCIVLQALWFPAVRKNPIILWGVSVLLNVGMWSERFVIIVTSLYHDFLPSSWHHYSPTWVDFSLLFGSMSFFLWLFLLFIKFVPFIPISEMKEMKHELEQQKRELAEATS